MNNRGNSRVLVMLSIIIIILLLLMIIKLYFPNLLDNNNINIPATANQVIQENTSTNTITSNTSSNTISYSNNTPVKEGDYTLSEEEMVGNLYSAFLSGQKTAGNFTDFKINSVKIVTAEELNKIRNEEYKMDASDGIIYAYINYAVKQDVGQAAGNGEWKDGWTINKTECVKIDIKDGYHYIVFSATGW